MPYQDKERQREALRKSANRRRKAYREFVDEYKLEHGCKACSYRKCVTSLEFHHLDESTKVDTISKMVQNRRPISSIMAEMEKCIILCANCHRELHNIADG